MPTIVAKRDTRTVVVERVERVATVLARSSAVRVPDTGVGLTPVRRDTRVLEVTTRGLQGPPGKDGEDGSGADTRAEALPNTDLVPIIPGMPVCRFAGGYALARADDPAKVRVIGLAVGELPVPVGETLAPQVEGVVSMTIAQWEEAIGMPGGVVPDRVYYIGLEGGLTLDPPSGDGQYLIPTAVGISPRELHVRINTAVKL